MYKSILNQFNICKINMGNSSSNNKINTNIDNNNDKLDNVAKAYVEFMITVGKINYYKVRDVGDLFVNLMSEKLIDLIRLDFLQSESFQLIFDHNRIGVKTERHEDEHERVSYYQTAPTSVYDIIILKLNNKSYTIAKLTYKNVNYCSYWTNGSNYTLELINCEQSDINLILLICRIVNLLNSNNEYRDHVNLDLKTTFEKFSLLVKLIKNNLYTEDKITLQNDILKAEANSLIEKSTFLIQFATAQIESCNLEINDICFNIEHLEAEIIRLDKNINDDINELKTLYRSIKTSDSDNFKDLIIQKETIESRIKTNNINLDKTKTDLSDKKNLLSVKRNNVENLQCSMRAETDNISKQNLIIQNIINPTADMIDQQNNNIEICKQFNSMLEI